MPRGAVTVKLVRGFLVLIASHGALSNREVAIGIALTHHPILDADVVVLRCQAHHEFGTECTHVQKGQKKGYAINGTTLVMTKPGSSVPSLINGHLAKGIH